MLFAGCVLATLAVIFFEGMILYFYAESDNGAGSGQEIFDACKTILPPMMALVIGYYFGRNERRPTATEDETMDGED